MLSAVKLAIKKQGPNNGVIVSTIVFISGLLGAPKGKAKYHFAHIKISAKKIESAGNRCKIDSKFEMA